MTPETMEALKGSIEKWRKIVEEAETDRGATNCPLCALYNVGGNCCEGCPIKGVTGKRFCIGSPYELWDELVDYQEGRADSPKKLAAARAELEFLRGLLPQEEAS